MIEYCHYHTGKPPAWKPYHIDRSTPAELAAYMEYTDAVYSADGHCRSIQYTMQAATRFIRMIEGGSQNNVYVDHPESSREGSILSFIVHVEAVKSKRLIRLYKVAAEP